jgi:RNA polymerase sigma-70 factor (ECF subfamily)
VETGENSREVQITQLIVRHRASLYGFILAHTGDANNAEDIFQEVCLVVCEKWDTYDSTKSFCAWAMGIARNEILKQRRNTARNREVLLDPEIGETLVGHPAWEEDEGEEKQALRECMERLSPRTRQIVMMKFEENLRIAEIASRVRWKADSVSVTLTKAKKALFKCVKTRLAAWRGEVVRGA